MSESNPATVCQTSAEFSLLCEFIRRNKYAPKPLDKDNFAGGHFVNMGIGLMTSLVREGFKPHHAILDLGSGLGRLAVPLTQYITTGRYVGVDINLSGISWCHENIQSVYPNFEFILIDAFNRHYQHPAEYGQHPMTEVVIPKQKPESFDMICAFSLFTHLTQMETVAYIKQIGALMAPGGTFFSTWFLIDENSIEPVKAGMSKWKFKTDRGGPDYFLFDNPLNYSEAIGYDAGFIIETASKNNLVLSHPPTPGLWRNGGLGQDIMIFHKVP